MTVASQHTDDTVVWVRRQWNDWRDAACKIEDVSGYHWSELCGGVQARANRSYLHAYVLCDQMIKGELAHSCQHGPCPHRIKVCITKKWNKDAWKLTMAAAEQDVVKRAGERAR